MQTNGTLESLPEHAQILVIGGGPAGSYAASALARDGFDVVLFEAASFPRYHIGESLIPALRHYLRFIDAENKVEQYGFSLKPGAAVKLNQHKMEGYTDFYSAGPKGDSWNVTRAEFDQLLLDHAIESGARVYQNTKVRDIEFEPPVNCARSDAAPSTVKLGRACAATYTRGSATGHITFDYVVDASGRSGIISTRYLKNRKFSESLKNFALWGYWESTSAYMAGTGLKREGAPYFEALIDESGWAWFIPLADGQVSVGVVMNEILYKEHVKKLSKDKSGGSTTLAERYLSVLARAPNIMDLIDKGKLRTGVVGPDEQGKMCTHPTIKMASDFSYNASEYAGNGWRLAGDAGAFIDPFFSSGVHLALTGGLAAATSIAASIRGNCSEAVAAAWHTQRIAVSYTRFLVVVLGTYKQIRAQSSNALADVDEDNFDRAFKAIRPLIQGTSEFGVQLHNNELQDAMDFCAKLFAPTDDSVLRAAKDGLESTLLDMNAPVQRPEDIAHAASVFAKESAAVEEKDALLLLERVNARRVIQKEMGGIDLFEGEPFAVTTEDGKEIEGMWTAKVQRGALGLVKA